MLLFFRNIFRVFVSYEGNIEANIYSHSMPACSGKQKTFSNIFIGTLNVKIK